MCAFSGRILARIELSFRFAVDLEPRLRLLQLSSLASLHVRFGQKQGRSHAACNRTDAGQDEGPTEPVVGVLRHPLVLVAERGEHDDTDATADTGGQR